MSSESGPKQDPSRSDNATSNHREQPINSHDAPRMQAKHGNSNGKSNSTQAQLNNPASSHTSTPPSNSRPSSRLGSKPKRGSSTSRGGGPLRPPSTRAAATSGEGEQGDSKKPSSSTEPVGLGVTTTESSNKASNHRQSGSETQRSQTQGHGGEHGSGGHSGPDRNSHHHHPQSSYPRGRGGRFSSGDRPTHNHFSSSQFGPPRFSSRGGRQGSTTRGEEEDSRGRKYDRKPVQDNANLSANSTGDAPKTVEHNSVASDKPEEPRSNTETSTGSRPPRQREPQAVSETKKTHHATRSPRPPRSPRRGFNERGSESRNDSQTPGPEGRYNGDSGQSSSTQPSQPSDIGTDKDAGSAKKRKPKKPKKKDEGESSTATLNGASKEEDSKSAPAEVTSKEESRPRRDESGPYIGKGNWNREHKDSHVSSQRQGARREPGESPAGDGWSKPLDIDANKPIGREPKESTVVDGSSEPLKGKAGHENRQDPKEVKDAQTDGWGDPPKSGGDVATVSTGWGESPTTDRKWGEEIPWERNGSTSSKPDWQDHRGHASERGRGAGFAGRGRGRGDARFHNVPFQGRDHGPQDAREGHFNDPRSSLSARTIRQETRGTRPITAPRAFDKGEQGPESKVREDASSQPGAKEEDKAGLHSKTVGTTVEMQRAPSHGSADVRLDPRYNKDSSTFRPNQRNGPSQASKPFSSHLTRVSNIQKLAMKPIGQGKDVIAQSQSQKDRTNTLAIALLQKLSAENKACQAILICSGGVDPQKVYDDLQVWFMGSGLSCIYLKDPIDVSLLDEEMPKQVVVATLGPLKEVLNNKEVPNKELDIRAVETGVVLMRTDEIFQFAAGAFEQVWRMIPGSAQKILMTGHIGPKVQQAKELYFREDAAVLRADELTLQWSEHYHVNVEDPDARWDVLVDIFGKNPEISHVVIVTQSQSVSETLANKLSDMNLPVHAV
ncbi:translation initiation factor eIF4A, partial [Podila horticola]